MEVQSNENAALLKLLKTKSRTKTELLKVSGARRRARQAALDALLAEGKVIRIDKEYFANDPGGSVEQLIDAEAARLNAYLRSVPDALTCSSSKLRRAVKDNALGSVALQRLLETGQVIELKYKKQRLCLHSHLPQQSAQVCHSQETSPDLDHDLSLQEVHQVYARVRGRQLGSAVFISDLATELKCQPRVRKNDRFSEPGCHLILLRGTFEIERYHGLKRCNRSCTLQEFAV